MTSFKIGRDARDGRFTTVDKARKDKDHHTVERIDRDDDGGKNKPTKPKK